MQTTCGCGSKTLTAMWYGARYELATSLGIVNYAGASEQDTALLNYLKNGTPIPQQLKQPPSGAVPKLQLFKYGNGIYPEDSKLISLDAAGIGSIISLENSGWTPRRPNVPNSELLLYKDGKTIKISSEDTAAKDYLIVQGWTDQKPSYLEELKNYYGDNVYVYTTGITYDEAYYAWLYDLHDYINTTQYTPYKYYMENVYGIDSKYPTYASWIKLFGYTYEETDGYESVDGVGFIYGDPNLWLTNQPLIIDLYLLREEIANLGTVFYWDLTEEQKNTICNGLRFNINLTSESNIIDGIKYVLEKYYYAPKESGYLIDTEAIDSIIKNELEKQAIETWKKRIPLYIKAIKNNIQKSSNSYVKFLDLSIEEVRAIQYSLNIPQSGYIDRYTVDALDILDTERYHQKYGAWVLTPDMIDVIIERYNARDQWESENETLAMINDFIEEKNLGERFYAAVVFWAIGVTSMGYQTTTYLANNYGSSASELIALYGDDAAKAILVYKEQAISLIGVYGDDVARALANRISPSLIYKLYDLGITPHDYQRYSIINSQAAETMAEAIERR